MKPICPYCSIEARLTTGEEIYPGRDDLWSLNFWKCDDCEAYVGCHKPNVGYGDGTRPMGWLANTELRRAKNEAHAEFDKLWVYESENKSKKRHEAYNWLSRELEIPIEKCHIGEFDIETCRKTIIRNLLGGHTTYYEWLRDKITEDFNAYSLHGFNAMEDKVQFSKHAWLNHLIKEYEAKGD